MTTKVHAVTDGLGNPLRFLLSSGNRDDICMAQTLLEPFDLNGKLILAEKHPRSKMTFSLRMIARGRQEPGGPCLIDNKQLSFCLHPWLWADFVVWVKRKKASKRQSCRANVRTRTQTLAQITWQMHLQKKGAKRTYGKRLWSKLVKHVKSFLGNIRLSAT